MKIVETSINTRNKYHPFAKFLHWSIVLIICVQFILAGIMPEIRPGQTPESLINFHMSFGAVVIPFVFALLFMRFYRPVLKPEKAQKLWWAKASMIVEYLLYASLLLLPLSGLAFASSRGFAVILFGVPLPSLFAQGSLFGDLHGIFVSLIMILALGHFSAAIYHRFVLKDSVVERMLPFCEKR
jgi:cytochrome b561